MCKILIIPGIAPDPKSQKIATKILAAAGMLMPKNDPHGFGYAALDHERRLWTEKWTDVNKVFRRPNPKRKERPKAVPCPVREQFLAESFGIVEAKSRAPTHLAEGTTYAKHGEIGSTYSAIMAHSRFATCALGINNTHPFVDNGSGIALIHNGVITHARGIENSPQSTCDSELILQGYISAGVHLGGRLDAIDDLTTRLSGSYAVGVLGSDHLDIFRNGGSSLYVGWIPSLKAPVFCTTRELLAAIMKSAEVKWEFFSEFAEDYILRLDPLTGRVLDQGEFETSGYSYAQHWTGYSGMRSWTGGGHNYGADTHVHKTETGAVIEYPGRIGMMEQVCGAGKSASESAQTFLDDPNQAADELSEQNDDAVIQSLLKSAGEKE